MPLWVEVWNSGTSHLSDAEDGLYGRMVRLLWQQPRQRFPNDMGWLARKFRRSVEDAEATIRPLVVEFFQTDGNWITHKRVTREWRRAAKTTKQRSDAAKSRWNKEKTSSERNADTPSGRIASRITDTITDTEKKEESPLPPKGGDTFAAFYAVFPRKVARGQAAKAYRGALRKTTADVLLAAAAAFAQQVAGKETEFIPYPATWLNGERWLDEKELFDGQQINGSGHHGQPKHRDGWAALAATIIRERGDDEPF